MFSMNQLNAMMTRRQFFGRSARGLGAVALACWSARKIHRHPLQGNDRWCVNGRQEEAERQYRAVTVRSDILNRVQKSCGRLEVEIRKLLHEIRHIADQALSHAKALIQDLDQPVSAPDPRGGDRRNVPVPFSGLSQAILREVRSAERHVGKARPRVSSPNGSRSRPMANAIEVSATGVPIVP